MPGMKTGLLTVKKTFIKQNNLNKVINIITDLHDEFQTTWRYNRKFIFTLDYDDYS
jgi:hypothetical protein